MSREEPAQSPEKLVIATEIIKGRELLGMTQAQLSAVSRVSLSAIKGYETGRNVPGARELKQLCTALRVSPNRMIFGVDEPFQAPVDVGADQSGGSAAPTDRERVKFLLQCLSTQECGALYALVHALAVARHGVEVVNSMIEGADFFTGLDLLSDTGEFDPYLHRMILKSPQVAREVGEALKAAAQRAQKTADAERNEKT